MEDHQHSKRRRKAPQRPRASEGLFLFPPHAPKQSAHLPLKTKTVRTSIISSTQATEVSPCLVYGPPPCLLYREKKERAPRFLDAAATFVPFKKENVATRDAHFRLGHSAHVKYGRLADWKPLLPSFPSESTISARFSPTATRNPLWPTLERPVHDSLLRPSQPWRDPSSAPHPIASDPGETLP